MPDSQLTTVVTAAASVELRESLRRIHHCLDQLTDEQISWRPNNSMNSIANLILHLCGNLRQWIISGVGGAEDTRDRQREFDDRRSYTKATLISAIDTTVADTLDVINKASADELVRLRIVQGRRDISGIHAIFHAVAHFQGHVQEIAHMTRVLVEDDYRFAFVPNSDGAGD